MPEQNLNLDQYKASGVYTVEIDNTVSLVIPLTIGRLAIGSSRIGPINTGVLLKDPKTGRRVYGNRDTFLENRGSYFHRTIETMLGEGPIYALNILPVSLINSEDNPDKSYFTTFNSEFSTNNGNEVYEELGADAQLPKQAPIKDFFNRQKFWYASDTELTKTKNENLGETNSSLFGQIPAANKILSFVNLSKKPITVFVQKSAINGYDVTVKEWYNALGPDIEIPNFLHTDDFISDYFIDIIVVAGNWNNYLKLSQDPIYYKYFDKNGLKVEKLNDFLALNDVNLISRVSGCLIPDFQDSGGNIIAIDRIFNNLYPLTEILCSLDIDKLETMDLDETEFTDALIATHRVDLVGYGFDELDDYTTDDHDNKLINVLSYTSPTSNIFEYEKYETSPANNGNVIFDTSETYDFIKAYEDSKIYKTWKSGFLKSGDINKGDALGSPVVADTYIKVEGSYTDAIGDYIIIRGYSDNTLLNEQGLYFYDNDGTDNVKFDTSIELFSKEFDLDADFDSYEYTVPNKLRIETTELSDDDIDTIFEFIAPDNYIKAKTLSGRTRLLKILSVAKETDSSSPAKDFYLITVMNSFSDEVEGIDIGIPDDRKIVVQKALTTYIQNLRGLSLTEFKIREQILPNGTAARQRDILDFIFDTGLVNAIAEGEALNIRHLVDTYEGEIGQSSKYNFLKLAVTHKKTLAFVNDPSIEQFEKSTDPSFLDTTTGLISAEYITQGGNLTLNPSYTFKFPSETINQRPIESYGIFTMPNLIIREGGKNKSIPAAGYVSNAYIRRIKGGNPYGIVAAKNGIITEPEVIGPEYDFSDSDRYFLEPAGHNLIIRRRGIGVMLFTNNTAYQKVESALNNAHVRNNLITIENDIESILFNFLFDFHDEITQIRVKGLIRSYLDGVKAARGIKRYDTIFDSSNNPDEVINADVGIVDVIVEFTRGIHKFINRITIKRAGGELSATQGGFVPAIG